MRRALLLAAFPLLAACASPRPRLYPDAAYERAGREAAEKDVDECLGKANEFLKAHPVNPVAKRSAWGAVAGAAMGAAVGAITGDIGRAVSSGAAAGGAGGAVHGAFEASTPDEVKRAYVDRCLAEKGYSVLGWR